MPVIPKRKAVADVPSVSSKRTRKEVVEIIELSDSEDNMPQQSLVQKTQQAGNGHLMRKHETGSEHLDNEGDFIMINSDIEGDEALARRLQEEWAQETIIEESLPKASSSKIHNHIELTVQPSRTSLLSTSSDAPPDERLREFRSFFTADRDCTKCGKTIAHPRGKVTFSSTLIPPSLVKLLHAPCKSCRTNHCRGCFTPIACSVSCSGSTKTRNCPVIACCAEARAIAIFETLSIFDKQFLDQREKSAARAQAFSMNSRAVTALSVGPGGTGYGINSNTFQTPNAASKSHVQAAILPDTSRKWEEIVLRTLQNLMEFLPAPYKEDSQVYDMLPHASIGLLLSTSYISVLLSDLLRNDSVTDWISRSATYYAMINLLRRMAESELTVHVVLGQRWNLATSCGIGSWMWQDGELRWEIDNAGNVEKALPLYQYFTKLTKHCEAFLAGASQMLGEESNDAGVDETLVQGASLCGDIIAARDDMDRVISIWGRLDSSTGDITVESLRDQSIASSKSKPKAKTKGKSKGKGKNIEQTRDVGKEYAEACEGLALKHVLFTMDEEGKSDKSNYNYAAMLHSADNVRNPKDRLHLIKELAVMSTGLPPGIWVRVDEVRIDAIKIMIAGPNDTPYAGGLFEFDCLMPVNYPNTPPLMYLRTTGGGRVRFNPNLYNNGKVCLSLLGTWPGRAEENWTSKSTLLQILVSIQSMILIDAPFFNEPGFGSANLKDSRSISYNHNIRQQTTKWAILDWLKDGHQHGIWKDVIVSHFSLLETQIRKQITDWAKDDALFVTNVLTIVPSTLSSKSSGVSNGTMKTVSSLMAELDKGMEEIRSWR